MTSEPNTLKIYKNKTMKKLITICLIITTVLTSQAQEKQKEVCDCPEPKGGKFIYFCTLVENQDKRYVTQMMEIACADPKKDLPETVRAKVQCMFAKYYAEFGCDSTGFSIAQGNILKYAVNQEFENFIYGMVEEFGIDINIKDPADGKTLLDFILDEKIRYKRGVPEYQFKAKELEDIYNTLRIDYYALHANELKHKINYRRGVKINLPKDVLQKYVGKYSLKMDATEFTIYITLENDKLFFASNNAKPKEINPETDTVFFDKPNLNTRYYFTLNKSTAKYDLTYAAGEIKYKTKRLE